MSQFLEIYKFTVNTIHSVKYCVFVEGVCFSVWQADGQRILVDQGKVSESTVIHAGHVWNIWTYWQCPTCFTGNLTANIVFNTSLLFYSSLKLTCSRNPSHSHHRLPIGSSLTGLTLCTCFLDFLCWLVFCYSLGLIICSFDVAQQTKLATHQLNICILYHTVA